MDPTYIASVVPGPPRHPASPPRAYRNQASPEGIPRLNRTVRSGGTESRSTASQRVTISRGRSRMILWTCPLSGSRTITTAPALDVSAETAAVWRAILAAEPTVTNRRPGTASGRRSPRVGSRIRGRPGSWSAGWGHIGRVGTIAWHDQHGAWHGETSPCRLPTAAAWAWPTSPGLPSSPSSLPSAGGTTARDGSYQSRSRCGRSITVHREWDGDDRDLYWSSSFASATATRTG